MFGHWADIELKRETCLKCCGVGLVAPSPLPGISSRSAIEHVEEFSDKDLGAHIFPLEVLNFYIHFDFQKAESMAVQKCLWHNTMEIHQQQAAAGENFLKPMVRKDILSIIIIIDNTVIKFVLSIIDS